MLSPKSIVFFVLLVFSHLRWGNGSQCTEIAKKLDSITQKIDGALRLMNTLSTSYLAQCSGKQKKYKIVGTQQKTNYDGAQQMCREMGGQLLQTCLERDVHGKNVNYATEIAAIMDEYPISDFWDGVYVGVNDRAHEGRWVYETGGEQFTGYRWGDTKLLYYWGRGQPQNEEDCGGIHLESRTLHDYDCNRIQHALCEIEIEVEQ